MFSIIYSLYHLSIYHISAFLPFFLPPFFISLFLFSLFPPSFFHFSLPHSFPSFLLYSLASFLPSLFFFFLICLYIEKLEEDIWEMFPVVVSSERDFIFHHISFIVQLELCIKSICSYFNIVITK